MAVTEPILRPLASSTGWGKVLLFLRRRDCACFHEDEWLKGCKRRVHHESGFFRWKHEQVRKWTTISPRTMRALGVNDCGRTGVKRVSYDMGPG